MESILWFDRFSVRSECRAQHGVSNGSNGKHSPFNYISAFKQKRRFLLFSSIDSSRVALANWLESAERNYDVALYVYEGEIPDKLVEFAVRREGFKFENFYHFCKQTNIMQYDAVWIVDEDIQIATASINRLFEIFKEYGLWLAQPAYRPDQDVPPSSWEMCFYDPKYRLRYTNYVENGVAMFSRNALKLCLPSMKDIRTGWCAEFLWSKLLGFPNGKIAVIDEVQCVHPNTMSSLDRKLPRHLHHEDGRAFLRANNAEFFTPKVLGGVRAVRNEKQAPHIPARLQHPGALFESGLFEKAEALLVEAQAKTPGRLRPFLLHHRLLEGKRRKNEI